MVILFNWETPSYHIRNPSYFINDREILNKLILYLHLSFIFKNLT